MRKFTFLLLLTPLFHCLDGMGQSCGVSGIYGGGPFYNSASTTIPEVKASGFNTVIVWTIHIDSKGNFDFNAEFPIVANGIYIGTTKYPAFSKNMTSLKTQPTSVTRLEFGLSAYGSSTFNNIKTLIASEGTGPSSMLYKNFKALKDSVPAIDALNFDDESTYDVSSTVKFAVMLAGLGYKISLCPYTNSNYWTSVASQTNSQYAGAVDKIFLQCYDGGAANNPCSWNFNGLPIYPGLWDKNDTPANVQTKMTNWKKQCNINGGFMWLYDDFKGTAATKQYASAINNAVGIGTPAQVAYLAPANGATNVSLTPALSWKAGDCSSSHDVYFGTVNPPPFIINQVNISYAPSALSPNTTYYWRIDEKNFFGTTTGTVQSFTTLTPMGFSVLSEDMDFQISTPYPNPFRTEMSLDMNALKNSRLTVMIINQLGEEIYTLCNGKEVVGKHTFSWAGESNSGGKAAKGFYFVRINYDIPGNDQVKTKFIKVVYQ
jgi:hypothetical protein